MPLAQPHRPKRTSVETEKIYIKCTLCPIKNKELFSNLRFERIIVCVCVYIWWLAIKKTYGQWQSIQPRSDDFDRALFCDFRTLPFALVLKCFHPTVALYVCVFTCSLLLLSTAKLFLVVYDHANGCGRLDKIL